MNSKKEVCIKVSNIDKRSYVEKGLNCNDCVQCGTCTDMAQCPMIAHISNDVLRTTYHIDASKLHIYTGTYGHDFRRALDVVNMAIDNCRYGR